MTTFDEVTTAGATAAVTSPFWLPAFHNVSQIAADTLPILGLIWLVVQIVSKLYVTFKKKKDED